MVRTPLTEDVVKTLRIGNEVLLSGTIYTARDMAHARLQDMIKKGEKLPFNVSGAVIYYVGPSPARPGLVIGSAGPTTSYRMDKFVPAMFKAGMLGMIGKGPRSEDVRKLIEVKCGIYFGATGGAGALLSESILESEIIAFPDLGTEALRKLTVKDMPLIVVNDCYGGDLFSEGIQKYKY
ncbi:MAG: FumA C-terminus/TtdB family hydratase beta subunit [Spirochaetota bacterium]|nr:FumA C-terminus/TtdB family hydratase beta subunit [Spirochaetota bacterium]